MDTRRRNEGAGERHGDAGCRRPGNARCRGGAGAGRTWGTRMVAGGTPGHFSVGRGHPAFTGGAGDQGPQHPRLNTPMPSTAPPHLRSHSTASALSQLYLTVMKNHSHPGLGTSYKHLARALQKSQGRERPEKDKPSQMLETQETQHANTTWEPGLEGWQNPREV